MNLTIILLFFLLPLVSLANEGQRHSQMLAIINDELRDVARLQRNARRPKGEFILREAELYLEKARLIRDQENKKYLSLNPKLRTKSKRREYFKESIGYFRKAQNSCNRLLKKFRRFKNKARVYYILAHNAMEFQNRRKAKTYFRKVVKNSRPTSSININSTMALAEMYYNDHQYRKAIPLYRRIIKIKREDKWHTKHLHSLAWCYFRTKKISSALATMKEVYYKSKKSKYVDMSALAAKDLATFYADSKRIDQAVAFFAQNSKNAVDGPLTMARNLKQQGKLKQAIKVLKSARQRATSKADKIRIAMELLSVYQMYDSVREDLILTEELFKYYQAGDLKGEDSKAFVLHLKTRSAKLQKAVGKKRKGASGRKRLSKANAAVKYFSFLAKVEKNKDYLSIFYAGEVLYTVAIYNQAADKYYQAYQLATQKRQQKIKGLALEGLMAALGKKSISKASKKKYLKTAYILYLKEYPKKKKVDRIYQRLFGIYMSEKNIVKAEELLVRYRRKFPRQTKVQEAMLARVMDHHKNTKNRQGILRWISKINNKEFVVSKRYARKVRSLLTGMQFEKIEKATSSGNKKEALRLYYKVYDNPATGTREKQNAAYNIAVLFHELSDGTRTYGWIKRALKLMKPSDVKKFQSSLILMASDIFGQQMVKQAAEINTMAFEKLCSLKSSYKNVFFRNSILLSLAENNLVAAKKTIDKGNKCRIGKKQQMAMKLDFLKALYEAKKWSNSEEIIDQLAKYKENYPELIYPLSKLRRAYFASGRREKAYAINQRILDYYKNAKAKRRKIPLEALDIVSQLYLRTLKNKAKELRDAKLRFPEKVYNQNLKAKFALLDSITVDAKSNISIGSGKGIVQTYRILVDSYRFVANEISSFVPPGKSSEYVASFRKSMQGIANPLRSKAEEFFQQGKQNIKGSNILSANNHHFLQGKHEGAFAVQYFPPERGVLMDRGGRR